MDEDQKIKDYLQDILLFAIYDYSGSNALVFKGGTALHKVYGLDRYSDDLDFSLDATKLHTPPLSFAYSLRDHVVSTLSPIYDARMYVHRTSPKAPFVQYNADVYISDAQKNSATIELNIKVADVYRKTEEKRIATSRVTYFVSAMNKDEILAEKVRAILTRRNYSDMARDVVDLDFIKNIGGTADKKLIVAKLKESNIKTFSVKTFNNRLNLITDKIWQDGLSNIMTRTPNKKEMITSVIELIQKAE